MMGMVSKLTVLNLTVITNNVQSGASNGVSVTNSNQLTIENNSFKNNQHGLYLNNVGTISVLNNVLESNAQTGMRVDRGGWHIITGNTFEKGLTGIELISSEQNTLSSNTASNNDGNGIRISGGTGNIITNNTANNNQGIGFLIESDSDPATFTGNTATGNGISDFEGYAVAVDDPLSDVDLQFTDASNTLMLPTPYGTGYFFLGNLYGATLQGGVANTGEGLAVDVDVRIIVLDPNGSVLSNALALNGINIGSGSNRGISWSGGGNDYTGLGTYTYTITIDPDNKINETNENNNVFTGSFEVVEEIQFPVDLQFTDASNTLMLPTPYGTGYFFLGNLYGATLQGGVANTGEGLAVDVDVRIIVLDPNGSVLSNALALNGINIGSGSNRGISWSGGGNDYTGLGTYTYTITIDPDNKINETNENNNVFTGSFEVVEEIQFPVDLQFTDASNTLMLPTPYGTGYFFLGNLYGATLQGGVANTGEGLAVDVDVRIIVLDPNGSVLSNALALNGINIGSGSNRGISWSGGGNDYTGLGTYTYTITIDPDNKINETNENNNVFTGSFEVVEIQQTCFTSAGYSKPWTSDPDTSSRDVQISGKLAPKQNGQCILSNELSLEGQPVTVTATKNGVSKTATVTTGSLGLFNSNISFTDDADEGPWDVTFLFSGQGLYLPTTEFINGMESFTIVVPAPPPNPIPIVNVPNDITLYTGTPSFSFAQSTINYNLYSGNSGPVFYPQPTASITGVSSEIVTFDVTATDNDLSSGPTCDVTSGSEFSVGTTTVTCTATDSDGGVGTASFDVTVIEQYNWG